MNARRELSPPWALLVFLGVLLYSAYKVHEVLAPFALGCALAYLLNPLVHFFAARGLRREQVVLAFYLILALLITVAANSLLPAVAKELVLMQQKAPLYLSRTEVLAQGLKQDLARRLPLGQSLVENWSLQMYDPIVRQIPKIPQYMLGLFPLFSLAFLVPFITFFLLMDAGAILQQAIQICPSPYVEQALHLASEIETSLGNYVRATLIIAMAIGSASFLGLWSFGVDYALGISALAGVSSFVPYLGALLGAVVGALVAFFQFKTLVAPLKVLLLFGGIRLADEAFLQPIISRYSMHLHPLALLLALMIGGKLFGFIGLLFAVPAACVLKALLRVGWYWYASESYLAAEPTGDPRIPYV